MQVTSDWLGSILLTVPPLDKLCSSGELGSVWIPSYLKRFKFEKKKGPCPFHRTVA